MITILEVAVPTIRFIMLITTIQCSHICFYDDDSDGEDILGVIMTITTTQSWNIFFYDDDDIKVLVTTVIQVSRIGVERERTDMKIEEEEELFKNLKSKVIK